MVTRFQSSRSDGLNGKWRKRIITVYSLFTTCPRGLEKSLAVELQVLGCTDARSADSGVPCQGAMEQVYRTSLQSCVVSRVLLQLARGDYRNEHDIYKLAKNINWAAWFAPKQTFRVKVEGEHINVKSLDFVGLRIEDAPCDALHEACGIRPSVDEAHLDVRVYAFVDERRVQILPDTSDGVLFKRDYRQDVGEAPLRKNLVTGLLLLTKHDGTRPFQDPFCGSGIIVIETAWITTGHVPGLMRRLGLEKPENFDRSAWKEIRRQAVARIEPPSTILSGSDSDHHMVHTAQVNT